VAGIMWQQLGLRKAACLLQRVWGRGCAGQAAGGQDTMVGDGWGEKVLAHTAQGLC
jgi:hypothetical protein